MRVKRFDALRRPRPAAASAPVRPFAGQALRCRSPSFPPLGTGRSGSCRRAPPGDSHRPPLPAAAAASSLGPLPTRSPRPVVLPGAGRQKGALPTAHCPTPLQRAPVFSGYCLPLAIWFSNELLENALFFFFSSPFFPPPFFSPSPSFSSFFFFLFCFSLFHNHIMSGIVFLFSPEERCQEK